MIKKKYDWGWIFCHINHLLQVNIYYLDQINLTKNQFLSQCITLSLPVCEAQPKQRQKSNYEKNSEILLVLTALLKKSFQNDGFLILAVVYTIPMKKKGSALLLGCI